MRYRVISRYSPKFGLAAAVLFLLPLLMLVERDLRVHRQLQRLRLPSSRRAAAVAGNETAPEDTFRRVVADRDILRSLVHVVEPTFPAPANVGGMNTVRLRELLRSTRYPNGVRSPNLAFVVHHHHQPSSAAETVEQLQDGDVAYFIKACKKFNVRARAMYDSWAKSSSNVYFSTDQVLDGIPHEKQIITSLAIDEVNRHIKKAEKWEPGHHVASCVLTTINMGKLLSDKLFPARLKWLVFLDDDTFVVRRNLLEYLSVFPSAGSYFLGLSNAEIPGYMAPHTRAFVPVTATAPGVAYSRQVVDRLRRHDNGIDLGSVTKALDVCTQGMNKDDVAIGYIPLVVYGATYVARPDLRGYHFKSMKDPTHLKPLTIHTELQDFPKDLGHIFQDLQRRFNST